MLAPAPVTESEPRHAVTHPARTPRARVEPHLFAHRDSSVTLRSRRRRRRSRQPDIRHHLPQAAHFPARTPLPPTPEHFTALHGRTAQGDECPSTPPGPTGRRSPSRPRRRQRATARTLDARRAVAVVQGDGGRAAAEQLILHYSPLVKYVAGRVSVGLPPNVEQADFVSSGVFGLIDAIEKFDIDREIKFETYAITRIRGAMIDELRALDWIPRSVRQKARNVERAYATLEARLRRTPTEGRGRRRAGHGGRRTARGVQPVVAGQRRRPGGAAARRR